MSDNRDDRPRGPGRGGPPKRGGGGAGRGDTGRSFGRDGKPGGKPGGKPAGAGKRDFKGGGKPGGFQRDDRPPRDGDERRAPRGEGGFGERKFGDRKFGDRKFGDRPFGDRKPGERHGGERHGGGRGHDFGRRPGDERGFKPRQDRGGEPRGDFADRNAGGARGGDRPFRRPEGKPGFKPRFDRPRSERPYGERPRNDRPFRKTVTGEAYDAPREDGLDRISKIMARAGVASRRDAEAMIEAGRVAVNGETIAEPGTVAGPHDVILVDGQPLPPKEKTRLWLYHKPAGLVTTAHDPEGRPTVFDNLPEGLPRVVSVGRLDINTEGLLLLTNDGGLAQVLAHPKTGWLRRYRVRAHGQIDASDLERLADGIEVDGMHYGPIEARIDRVQGDNIWLTLGLREGKNREVKRVLEHLGLQVNRLIRVSFGPFQLGEMDEGQAEEVRTRILRDQLGPELTRAAEADFDLPAVERLREGFHTEHEARREAPRRREGEDRPERGQDRPERSHDRHEPRERGRDRPAPREREREAPGPREVLERGGRGLPARSVWRDAETETARPHSGKKPRRGEDPVAARAADAARPRTRAGKVESPSGRAVLVERVTSSDPSGEGRLFRKTRGAAPRDEGRGERFRDDRGRDERGRDERAPREGGDRPFTGKPRGKPSGDRPFSGKPSFGKPGAGRRDERDGPRAGGEGGFRSGPRGDRPGGFKGGGPRSGGPKGGGGFKGGGFKGGRPGGRGPAR